MTASRYVSRYRGWPAVDIEGQRPIKLGGRYGRKERENEISCGAKHRLRRPRDHLNGNCRRKRQDKAVLADQSYGWTTFDEHLYRPPISSLFQSFLSVGFCISYIFRFRRVSRIVDSYKLEIFCWNIFRIVER